MHSYLARDFLVWDPAPPAQPGNYRQRPVHVANLRRDTGLPGWGCACHWSIQHLCQVPQSHNREPELSYTEPMA